MRKLIATLMLLAVHAAFASPRESLLVSSSRLAENLRDPKLVLLHVGNAEDYAKEHIPGARHVALSDIALSDHSGKGLMLEMPPADDLRARLEKLGISDDSRIVVYYGKDWVSPATRVIFTLDYAGLGARTSLLDGGMGAWTAAGNKTTAAATPAKSGKLSPLTIHPIVVDASYVRTSLGRSGIVLIDGRAPAFYDGVDTGGSHDQAHRTGHIAGARSIPYIEIADDSLRIRSEGDLRALFAKAGVKAGDTVLAYCHIGQQATAVLFAARTLGHDVRLYDGSFEDWSRQQNAPVENPSEAKR